MEFHRETHHNVGRCSCRCDFCDKPQQSVQRKLEHHKTCDSGPNKDGALTQWCDQEGCGYSCQTTQTMKKHMTMDHPDAVGLTAMKRWKCKVCGKEFRSPQGSKAHNCMKVKVCKPQKKHTPVPDIGKYEHLLLILFFLYFYFAPKMLTKPINEYKLRSNLEKI